MSSQTKDRLYFFTINDKMEQVVFNRLLARLSQQKRVNIEDCPTNMDKKLGLLTELVVRFAACSIFGLSNKELVFERGEYGKPRLKGCDDFYYSIAHSKGAAVVILSGAPVGVDIERIEKARPFIARRFFTDEEREYLRLGGLLRDRRFFEIWTKKEAYIKWTGRGLSTELKGVHTLAPGVGAMITTFEKGGYVVSVCTENGAAKLKIVELTEEEIVLAALSLSPV